MTAFSPERRKGEQTHGVIPSERGHSKSVGCSGTEDGWKGLLRPGTGLCVLALMAFVAVMPAAPAAAKAKRHETKCRAGYVRRVVRIPKRRHGHPVRSHGKIVYERVRRCVKASKPKRRPTPVPPTPVPPSGPTSPVTPPIPPSGGPPPPPPPPQSPVNVSLPTISGTAIEGSTLTASHGTWGNSPTSFAYQWQDCASNGCSGIPGATKSTYTLQLSDVLDTVQVVVTATNAGGSASAVSRPTGVVMHSGDPVVVAVGDIACPAGDRTNNCEQQQTAALAASQKPDDVLALGDNQYNHGAFSEYESAGAYNDTWGVFDPIVHPVPGNHEYDTSGAAGYFQYFGDNGVTTGAPGGYYSFNIGTWHVIALNSDCTDSGCSDSVAGTTSSAQLAWLQADLAANRRQCVLAYWHHPLFSSGNLGDSPGVAPLWTALYNAHADVVLNGHDHVYERFTQQDPNGNATTGGIREFVAGTGGENLFQLSSPPATLQAWDNKDFGVLVLTLHASSYDWKFVNTSGAVVDSGSTACHGSGGSAIASSPRTIAAIAARDVASAHIAAQDRREPRLVFGALPLHSSLSAAMRRGLRVAVHCSRGCDVGVTVWLRVRDRLRRIGRFWETESQIPAPYSEIVLRLPAAALEHLTRAKLVLRLTAIDAAEHHRVVTTGLSLGR
jgi:Calcineurin-like phosphoesterase